MGILDLFKRSEIRYFKKENKCTGLILYYECKKRNDIITTRIIEKCPSKANVEVLEIGDIIHPIFKEAISKCNDEFKSNARKSDDYFSMEDLYRLKEIDTFNYVKEAYEKYIKLKDKLNNKCQSNGITVEHNEQKAYEGILERIDEECKRESKERGCKISFNPEICKTEEKMNNELENQLKGKNNTHIFVQARFELANYFSYFIEQLPWALKFLNKQKLSENEKLVLERYAETFEAIPKIVQTIEYLDSCAGQIEKEKYRKIRERNTTRSCK